jgi:topoisomerase (DNA) II binding protein 1
VKFNQKVSKSNLGSTTGREVTKQVKAEPLWFILSGHRLQRKEYQKVIKSLKGKLCRDSHQWSYQATHYIAPGPIRRTEKFFAAAASGRYSTLCINL